MALRQTDTSTVTVTDYRYFVGDGTSYLMMKHGSGFGEVLALTISCTTAKINSVNWYTL